MRNDGKRCCMTTRTSERDVNIVKKAVEKKNSAKTMRHNTIVRSAKSGGNQQEPFNLMVTSYLKN